jgi:hypothetical protein
VQLVTASIPRAFGAAGADVAVVLAPGSLEVDAVRRALDEADASSTDVIALDGPLPRTWRAVVLVLHGQPVPTSTRALAYAGLLAGTEHVSVVHGSTTAGLTEWLAATTDRTRRTRLAELLTP